MVVGKGLLAKAFSHFQNDESVIVFASGVSNSNTLDPLHFEREINLLRQYLNQRACLIYFSTVSVFDTSLINSQYIIHKKKIEKLIQENCIDYFIFRLPILVGETTNTHTLTNHLVQQIKGKQLVTIFSNACRYLMDIDDVSKILGSIICNSTIHNRIWNCCFNNRIEVPELISIIEKILEMNCEKSIIEKGECYKVPNHEFLNYLQEIKFQEDEFYNERILRKYYSIGI